MDLRKLATVAAAHMDMTAAHDGNGSSTMAVATRAGNEGSGEWKWSVTLI